MKIICIAGGSYKSFYLNERSKIKRCDLLVFNYGIIYDYIMHDEILGSGIVTKELLNLSKMLGCTIVAGVYSQCGDTRDKSIIICDGEKIHLSKVSLGAKLLIKGYSFIVGDEYTLYSNANKIVLTKSRIYPVLKHCSMNKIYIFCDEFGVGIVENRKYLRKFNKLSKIVLK